MLLFSWYVGEIQREALLDELEPVQQATTVYRPRQALGYLPLLAALLGSFLLALRHWLQSGGMGRR